MDFTMKDVEQEVRRLVQENPDFVYGQQEVVKQVLMADNCSYLAGISEFVYDDALSEGIFKDFKEDQSFIDAAEKGLLGMPCIVGQALQNLGVSKRYLYDHEGTGAQFVVGSLGLESGGVNEAAFPLWLYKVQSGQDSNMTWKISLANADEEYGVELNRA